MEQQNKTNIESYKKKLKREDANIIFCWQDTEWNVWMVAE